MGFPLILSALAVLAIFALIHRPRRVPSHLPWVGEGNDSWYGRLKSFIQSITSTHKMIEEGYDKYSKTGSAFVLPILFTGAEIMLPPSSLNWIHDQPEDILSGFEAHREFMRADWTLLHPTIIHEHIFQTVISKQLTRHLDTLEGDLRAEAPVALDTHITPTECTDWHEVDGYKSWKRTILQVVSRIYVGVPLCRDQEYISNAANFNRYSMLIAGLIGLVPSMLRPLLAPLICLPDRYFHAACARKTQPLLQKSLETIRSAPDNEHIEKLPNTLITWATLDAQNSKAGQFSQKNSLAFLAARMSVMNFVSIDSTTITLGNVLFDIVHHPYDATYSESGQIPLLERLREEARAAIARQKQDPTARRKVTDNVPILDACLKESFRMGNFVSRTTVKMVMKSPGVDVPGVGFVQKGVKVGIPLWGIHHDERIYENPYQWRMSRWLNEKDKNGISVFGGNASEIGQQYLPFGFRRSACPGRFFAMRVVKLILIELLLHYDIERVGSERPVNLWLGVSRGPAMEGRLRIRRKRTAPPIDRTT